MRARAVALLVFLAAAVAVTACASPRATGKAGVVLEVERSAYAAGEVVDLRLHNGLDEAVGFNACTWKLQRRDAEGWRPAPFEDQRACTMVLHMLAPGEAAPPAFPLDTRLPAGQYRLRAVLHRRESGTRTVRVSDPFRIER